RHTRCLSDWSSDVCSSDLKPITAIVDELSAVEGTLRSILAPTSKGTEARDMGLVIRKQAAKLAAETLRAVHALHEARDYMEKLRSEERRVGKEGRSRGLGR